MRLRQKRTDRNHQKVMDAYRSLGCVVVSLHTVGKGCGDILVARSGRALLVEIKDPEQPPSKRQLTKDEKDFHATWPAPIPIIETVDDVVRSIRDYL